VQAVADGDELVLSVTNTGPVSPAPAAEAAASPGIGLANTRQRLTELYGSRAAMTLAAHADGGAIAIIRLPLHGEMDIAPAADDSRSPEP
jgi:LytS/YehU family sensor histidine kinase